jgi:hypothetical protein
VKISLLIPGYQFGFRRSHSPIHQAHRVVHETSKSLEERTLSTAAFLDVAQAFDKLWQPGLLYKLKAALPAPYYLLLGTYLEDCYLQIRYNTTCSNCHVVRSGVPQDSILGPLLYLLFTADQPTTESTTIATFADDTGPLAVHPDPAIASQHLQRHLSLLHDWFAVWKIYINPAKSARYLHHATYYLPSSVPAH